MTYNLPVIFYWYITIRVVQITGFAFLLGQCYQIYLFVVKFLVILYCALFAALLCMHCTDRIALFARSKIKTCEARCMKTEPLLMEFHRKIIDFTCSMYWRHSISFTYFNILSVCFQCSAAEVIWKYYWKRKYLNKTLHVAWSEGNVRKKNHTPSLVDSTRVIPEQEGDYGLDFFVDY